MNDADLAMLVRDAVRDTHMTVPESDITRRARRLRTRRRVTAGGAAVASLAAGLAMAALAAPANSPATGHAQNTAQLTAWTVTKDPGGVIDVTIRELKDPAGLQARLRADGVPINVSFSGPNPACDPFYPNYQYIPPMPPQYLGKPGNYPLDTFVRQRLRHRVRHQSVRPHSRAPSRPHAARHRVPDRRATGLCRRVGPGQDQPGLHGIMVKWS